MADMRVDFDATTKEEAYWWAEQILDVTNEKDETVRNKKWMYLQMQAITTKRLVEIEKELDLAE